MVCRIADDELPLFSDCLANDQIAIWHECVGAATRISELPLSIAAAGADVAVEYAARCQQDTVLGRDPDRGSSCCTLLASAVACGVLAAQAELHMQRLSSLLSRCTLAYGDLWVRKPALVLASQTWLGARSQSQGYR